MKNLIIDIINSSFEKENCINGLDEILLWIQDKNNSIKVNIQKITLDQCIPWFYDSEKGTIQNSKGSFFSIAGIQQWENDRLICEQPILLQLEIGYLGIICKKINGVMYFLMQAKIEPGNINKVQLSPTIQATKSNFMQMHGGKKPAYLDYFLNASNHTIIVNQIQSEQSSRFFHKRNRNIMIYVESDVEILPSHKWMTLGQIKQLMKYDNLVNMDTRTVLSCIPISMFDLSKNESCTLYNKFNDKSIFNSMMENSDFMYPKIYHYVNNYKMFCDKYTTFVPLKSLNSWLFLDDQIVSKNDYSFKVIFCDIEIEGREITKWNQPLFEAVGKALFGLACCDFCGTKKFLVKVTNEVGCFDDVEIGPTVQLEANYNKEKFDIVEEIFMDHYKNNHGILQNVCLSEEGGRFYCEENHNVILEISIEDLCKIECIPDEYFWVDYSTLNQLVLMNNCLNIQLRNLMSLLEW